MHTAPMIFDIFGTRGTPVYKIAVARDVVASSRAQRAIIGLRLQVEASSPRAPCCLIPSSRDGYLLNRCPKVNGISHPRLHRHACRTSSLTDVPQPVIDPSTWHSVTVSHAFLHHARISRHQPVGWRCSRQRGRPCGILPSVPLHRIPFAPRHDPASQSTLSSVLHFQQKEADRKRSNAFLDVPRKAGPTDERETIIPRPRLRPKG